ncbi:MAG: hypothetical protein Q4A59_04920 [Erysipelotrichaceae bacterium]|nr:hypothetical protein [Erysipelotrichaceae bacterium]
MEKEFISKKVLIWGLVLLIPSCVLCMFLGFLGIGVIISIGLIFHAAVLYQALENTNHENKNDESEN